MPRPRKACPVVVRQFAGRLEILAFHHPLAGSQLVKRTIEEAETVEDAATRELLEESGVIATAMRYLGTVQMTDRDQEWHFVGCECEQLAEIWIQRTDDGGGLDFEFFWHPLGEEPDQTWHPNFKRALVFIKEHISA